MSELCFDQVLFDAEIPKALLLTPSTREEWADVLGCDRSTLRRWESYLFNKDSGIMHLVYRVSARPCLRKGKYSTGHHLTPYQKFLFLFIKHQLKVGFRSVPELIRWLDIPLESGGKRGHQLSITKVNAWLGDNLIEEKHSDFEFSSAIAAFGLDEFREPSTREQWAEKLGVSYKTLTRWEKQVIGTPVNYDFLAAQLEGKPISQCRQEAKSWHDEIAGEYCHGDAGWKKLDGFQKLYLLAIRELRTANPKWTNRDIRNYLLTNIEGVPRCERLTREKFSNWLAQQS